MRYSLLLLTAAVATPAHADWYKAESKHFVVYADDKPDEVKAFATRLERFDKAMRVMRGVPDDRRGPAARVTVFRLATIDQLQKLYGKGGSIGGWYQARASGPVSFVPRDSAGDGGVFDMSGERILLHEYSHHFMFADWPSAIFPKWYVEGFAEYNSTAIFRRDGSIVFGAAPTDRAFGVADQNGLPLSTMLDPGLGKLDAQQSYVLYSRAWALTHYLTQTPERRKMLADYVAAINAGKSSDEAAKALGDIKALDFKLVSYVKSPRFGSIIVAADQIKIGDVGLRKLTPGESATMPALIRSQRGVDEATAKQVAAMARAEAAPFPNDPAAQNVVAEAEYDAGDFAAAGAAADRALAADPKSIHAMLYKGQALQAIATAAKATDAKTWGEVRRWYIAANRIDPEDPYPLILYYRSFPAAGQRSTASAENGMLYAAALAPFDLSLRFSSGLILLNQGKGAEARRQLAQVAYNPHGGKSAEMMRNVLDTLDKSGPEAARKQLVALMQAQPEDAGD